MATIRIVTHVYAENLPQYAVFLRAQLSSLIIHPPKVKTYITVCCTQSDRRVLQVLSFFKRLLGHRLFIYEMQPERLFRRAIGRNAEALSCEENLIWFTDVDYIFGKDCLTDLWHKWRAIPDPKPTMVWPKKIYKQKDQEEGDRFWQANIDCQGLLDIKGTDFSKSLRNKAIGGMQIVSGAFARQHGYLNGSKWMKEVDEPFKNFGEDVIFRQFCHSQGVTQSLMLPNLFRLRHTSITYR